MNVERQVSSRAGPSPRVLAVLNQIEVLDDLRLLLAIEAGQAHPLGAGLSQAIGTTVVIGAQAALDLRMQRLRHVNCTGFFVLPDVSEFMDEHAVFQSAPGIDRVERGKGALGESRPEQSPLVDANQVEID